MDERSADDPQPFPKPKPAIVVDGVVISESRVGPLDGINLAGPVMLADREGVFAHSWKCQECRLEFALFSWRRDRHRVGNVYCPECGRQTPMLHWRATFSSSREMVLDDSRWGESLEIFDCIPVGDADLLDDSSLPE